MKLCIPIIAVSCCCWSLFGGTEAFQQALPTIRHAHGKQPMDHAFRELSSSSLHAKNASDATENLSGLVTGLLQSHQDMVQEMAVRDAHIDEGMPPLDKDGIYRILNEKQYHNFLDSNSNQIVIVKFSSPFCKACQMLKQKFRLLHVDPKFQSQPVVIADISVPNNPNLQHVDDFAHFIVSSLGVTKIPTLHFYVRGQLVEAIVCGEDGCSWTKLKPQMVHVLEDWGPTMDAKGPMAFDMDDSNVPVVTADGEETPSVTSWRDRIHSFMSRLSS